MAQYSSNLAQNGLKSNLAGYESYRTTVQDIQLTLGGARNGPKLPHAEFDRGGTQNGPKLPHILGTTVSVTMHLQVMICNSQLKFIKLKDYQVPNIRKEQEIGKNHEPNVCVAEISVKVVRHQIFTLFHL